MPAWISAAKTITPLRFRAFSSVINVMTPVRHVQSRFTAILALMGLANQHPRGNSPAWLNVRNQTMLREVGLYLYYT